MIAITVSSSTSVNARRRVREGWAMTVMRNPAAVVLPRRPGESATQEATRQAREWQLLPQQRYGLCPSQKAACYALVGLLTSEFGLSGLLVACRQLGRPVLRDNGQETGLTLQHSVTAAGGRPGFAPGSLCVGPSK